MTRVGLIQTSSHTTNKEGIEKIAKLLKKLGNNETEIVCLPEQWLPNNQIKNYDQEFVDFKKIAKEFSMTIIPGAFYQITKKKSRGPGFGYEYKINDEDQDWIPQSRCQK